MQTLLDPKSKQNTVDRHKRPMWAFGNVCEKAAFTGTAGALMGLSQGVFEYGMQMPHDTSWMAGCIVGTGLYLAMVREVMKRNG